MGYRPKSRTLRPQFFTSEQVASVSCPARLCFAGLWCLADRDGRLEDKPNQIRIHLFPYDAKLNVDKLLGELQSANLICRYECDGVKVVGIPTFIEHQPVHPNEQKSRLPVIPSNYMKSKLKVGSPNGKGKGKGKGKGGVGGNRDVKIFENIRSLYIEICQGFPEPTEVSDWSPKRQGSVNARWKQHPDIDWWRAYFERIAKSDILKNGYSTWPGADLGWIILPSNMEKILEGRYDNKKEKRGQLTSEKDYGPEGGRPF